MADTLRRILHIDMDAFYASIEQRDDPGLRGQPVAVGGDPAHRGVVAAASYEARRFGVRSALSMARAVRLCPQLRIVPPDFARYRAVSARIQAIFHRATPLVEPLSLDEAYLDVTDNLWGAPLGVDVARRLKRLIVEETGLTASAGVAPNKFLAKIASAWQKPDGLTVIAPDRVEAFLTRLPVEALWGVGPVTARKLHAIGVRRLVDVRSADPDLLARTLGSQSDWLRRLALGIDDRPVSAERVRKSASAERTFPADLTDPAAIRTALAGLATGRAAWLQGKGLVARTVTIKVRYGDFSTVTRSHTYARATADTAEIEATVARLAARTEAGRVPVRLLGVGVHGLIDPRSPEDPALAGRLPFSLAEPAPADGEP